MRLINILAIGGALGLSACAPAPSAAPEPGAVREGTAELWTAATRTTLMDDAARRLARQCSRVSPGPAEDVWTPSEAQIQAIEDQLILELARQLEARGESPSPGDYYRQYAGLIVGGRRLVYVNGVAESAIERDPDPDRPFDWRTQAVLICDGGPITFGVEYDPATRTLSNFAFNGQI